MGFLGWMKCDSYKGNPVQPDTSTNVTVRWLPGKPVYIHDTLKLVKTEKQPTPTQLLPSGNYDSLLQQYQSLAEAYTNRNRYTDSTMIDSSKLITHVIVEQNQAKSIYYDWKPKFPVITITNNISIPEEKRRQVYLNYGGGIDYMPTKWAISGTLGLSYKDRQDRIYTANIEANTWQQYGIKLIRSGKISFRRKR